MKQMKRTTYILLALAALISTACSKPNTDNHPDTVPLKSYIFFEAGVLDVTQTKSSLITGESLPTDAGTSFGVIGFYEDGQPIFNEYTDNIASVYRKQNNEGFQYDNLASWMGTRHTFYAFYPYSVFSNILLDSDNIPYIDYTQPTAENNMIDVLGACSSVSHTTTSAAPVELEFQHLFWAFNLVINNLQSTETTDGTHVSSPSLTINEVMLKLYDFPKEAKLKLNADYDIDISSRADQSYTLFTDNVQISAGESESFGPLLFIPTTGVKYQISIKYTTQVGFVDTFVYPAEGQYKNLSSEFERGKLYVLTIDKENDKFFVGLSAGTWDEITVNHTFE